MAMWLVLFQRILSAEFIDGCNVDDVEGIKKRGLTVTDVSLCHKCLVLF